MRSQFTNLQLLNQMLHAATEDTSCIEASNCKLTNEQVLQIRKLRQDGWTLKRLAAKFGASFGLIGFIANRKSWAHI